MFQGFEDGLLCKRGDVEGIKVRENKHFAVLYY